MKVLITGHEGFIGRNLCQRLSETAGIEIVLFGRQQNASQLPELLSGVNFVFHLAGVNRPSDSAEYYEGNTELTQELCAAVGAAVRSRGETIPVLLASSIQARGSSEYGASKRMAEDAARKAATQQGFPLHIFRLPNVFGKWARPNYNSVVATFCHRLIRNLPIEIHNPDAMITLVYIDDVTTQFLEVLFGHPAPADSDGFKTVIPQYEISVGGLADQIRAIHKNRTCQGIGQTGHGFERALYSTYVSYLPPEQASYVLPRHEDMRGAFVEILKTGNNGQFSYFTARPGITRGGHYHHSKVEKFLVVAGDAKFRFHNVATGERFEKTVTGKIPEVVETIPGWAHDVTNVGNQELIVMLWANEVFDPSRPDTVNYAL